MAAPAGTSRKPYIFPDGTPMEVQRVVSSKKEFQYIQAVPFTKDCIGCHWHAFRAGSSGQDEDEGG